MGQGFAASLGKAGRNIFKQSPWKNLKGIGDGMRNSVKGFRQTNLGYRQIGQGERQIAAGRNMIARGNTMDARWAQAGVGLAGGSNLNGGRRLDGDWNMADIPVVGTAPPLLDYDYGHHSGPPRPCPRRGARSPTGSSPRLPGWRDDDAPAPDRADRAAVPYAFRYRLPEEFVTVPDPTTVEGWESALAELRVHHDRDTVGLPPRLLQ
ncbi:hypothetical protein [Streptomyces tendae]|uniref:hypothetical protein n=1 Tax=Streptomyces tendae TaxID=1932 RepID=UPI0037B51B45